MGKLRSCGLNIRCHFGHSIVCHATKVLRRPLYCKESCDCDSEKVTIYCFPRDERQKQRWNGALPNIVHRVTSHISVFVTLVSWRKVRENQRVHAIWRTSFDFPGCAPTLLRQAEPSTSRQPEDRHVSSTLWQHGTYSADKLRHFSRFQFKSLKPKLRALRQRKLYCIKGIQILVFKAWHSNFPLSHPYSNKTRERCLNLSAPPYTLNYCPIFKLSDLRRISERSKLFYSGQPAFLRRISSRGKSSTYLPSQHQRTEIRHWWCREDDSCAFVCLPGI